MYPALAVVQALELEDSLSTSVRARRSGQVQPGKGIRDEHDEVEILWVGSSGGMEADLVRRAGLAYQGIPAAGVHGVGLRSMPTNLWQIGRGLIAARRLLREFRPDVLFFTGGYVAVPVALATRLPRLGIPAPANLLYVPDIEPGWALKTLSRFADHIALTVSESKSYFKNREAHTTVAGYPTRRELRAWSRPAALEFLKLSPDLPVLLVVGGSTGARSINRAILTILSNLLEEMQVVHLAGQRDWVEVSRVKDDLRDDLLNRYRAFPYLHAEMGAALAAADLALSRAGASSLGEFPLFGLPAILVPYPHAWRYQEVNARYLARRHAALILEDRDLQDRLLPAVRDLMRDKSTRGAMSRAMARLARPEAAESIAGLLYHIAGSRSRRKV